MKNWTSAAWWGGGWTLLLIACRFLVAGGPGLLDIAWMEVLVRAGVGSLGGSETALRWLAGTVEVCVGIALPVVVCFAFPSGRRWRIAVRYVSVFLATILQALGFILFAM